jgi:hypothetical protein
MTRPEFPSRDFVVEAMATYFLDAGLEPVPSSSNCLTAMSVESGVRWVVEATGGPSLDLGAFEACLGRLLMAMSVDTTTNYVLAMPAKTEFEQQCVSVALPIQRALNLWWGLVSEDRSVLAVSPEKFHPLQGTQ